MTNLLSVKDMDMVFISYDEPNADEHYADLLTKFPYAKRSHGVYGSDSAHKAAAKLSSTQRFITVDADNIVSPEFAKVSINLGDIGSYTTVSWSAVCAITGSRYGNGGLKCWDKSVVQNQRTHENSNEDDSVETQIEFCWQGKYIHRSEVYSITSPTGSALQAWRAGYREGVKLTIRDGAVQSDSAQWYPENKELLDKWLTLGYGVEYGLWAMIGAREGLYDALLHPCYIDYVRDFEKLNAMFAERYPTTFGNDAIAGLLTSKKALEGIYKFSRDSFWCNQENTTYEPNYDMSMSEPTMVGNQYDTSKLKKSIQGDVISRVLSD